MRVDRVGYSYFAQPLPPLHPTQQKHIMAERNVLLKNVKHPFLVGLHYSFQTTDKLYFVLDFINGGEVGRSEFARVREKHGWKSVGTLSFSALLPPPKRAHLSRAEGKILHR